MKRRLIALFISVAACLASATALPAFAESLVVQQYRKALELDPENRVINYQISIALLKENNFAEAIERLGLVFEARPDDPDVNFYMGIAYAGLGELDRASEAYSRVEELAPGKAQSSYELDKVYYNLGIAYQKQEGFLASLKAYDRSIRINHLQSLAYCRKGEVLFELKQYTESLESFKTCELRNPGDTRVKRYVTSARLARGLQLTGEKRYPEALSEFRKVYESDPSNENAIYFQGYVHYQNADYKEALRALEALREPQSKDIFDGLPALLQNIGLELQTKEDWTGAERAFKRALDLRKKDPDLHYLLGFNYMKRGLYAQSLDALRAVLRIDPAHQKATLVLAMVTEKLVGEHLGRADAEVGRGRYAEAMAEYDKALSIDPKNQRSLKGKSDIEQKLAAFMREESKKKEDEISSRLTSASRYLQDGRFRDALVTYKYILALDPRNNDATQGAYSAESFIREKKERHLKKGDQYAAEDSPGMALKEYRAALEADPDDQTAVTRLKGVEKQLASFIAPHMEDAATRESRGDLSGALRAYEEALRLDPGNAEVSAARNRTERILETKFNEHYSKGRDHLDDGNFARALESFKLAERLKNDDPRVASGMGKAREGINATLKQRIDFADKAVKEGRYKEAASAYSEALELDRSNATALAGLNEAKRRLGGSVSNKLSSADDALSRGKYATAIKLYNEVLAIDRTNQYASDMRDQAQSKLDEAVVTLNKRATEAYNRGENDSAAEDFRKVLSYDPSNQTAKKHLSLLERAPAKEKKEGVTHSRDTEKLYLQGIELYTEGRYVDAIRAWEKVLSASPGHEKAAQNIEKAKKKLEGAMDVR